MMISNDPDVVLMTYSLGSCLGVAVYDPGVRVGGLIHIMLPDSSIEHGGVKNPFKYVDSGIPLFFKECYKLGAVKHRMIVKIAGCASILDSSDFFSIGKRNLAAVRKLFWKNGVMIAGEDVGGSMSRTMKLNMSDGTVEISYANNRRKVI